MPAITDPSSTFGTRLLRLRRAAGQSAERLAQQLGLHRNSIVAYESGAQEPSVAIVSALRETDMDWIYLLTGETQRDFVAERIDWKLVEEIWTKMETQLAASKQRVSIEKKFLVLRSVYSETKSRMNTDLLDRMLRVAA